MHTRKTAIKPGTLFKFTPKSRLESDDLIFSIVRDKFIMWRDPVKVKTTACFLLYIEAFDLKRDTIEQKYVNRPSCDDPWEDLKTSICVMAAGNDFNRSIGDVEEKAEIEYKRNKKISGHKFLFCNKIIWISNVELKKYLETCNIS